MGHCRLREIQECNPTYFRDAAAAVCVFDITNKNSLKNAESWIQELRISAPENIIIAVAANKSDLYEKEEVSLEQGRGFAMSNKVNIFY